MHRTGSPTVLDRAAVRRSWARAQHVVSPAGGRECGEPGADAADRRAVFADPFYGSRKLAEVLGVNHKRIQRLMPLMGIEAIYTEAAYDLAPGQARQRFTRICCGSGGHAAQPGVGQSTSPTCRCRMGSCTS